VKGKDFPKKGKFFPIGTNRDRRGLRPEENQDGGGDPFAAHGGDLQRALRANQFQHFGTDRGPPVETKTPA